MSINLQKRIFTSIILLFILITAFLNKFILLTLLISISFASMWEINFIISKIFKKKNKPLKYLINLFFLFYIFIFSFFIYLGFNNNIGQFKFIILFFISITIATDIGGLIFGKIFKGKKLTSISPNKTIAGLIGSYILSLFVLMIIISFLNIDLNFKIIILTLILSTCSQMGDLFISFLKRKAKIKDTGRLLPGHGGILDRIDGILFGWPLCYFIWLPFI